MPGKYRFTKLDSPRDTESLREVLRELCAPYGVVVRVRIGFVTKPSFLQAICFVDMKQKVPVPAALRKLGFRRNKSSFYVSFHLPADFSKGVTTVLLFTQQLMDSFCVPVLLGC